MAREGGKERRERELLRRTIGVGCRVAGDWRYGASQRVGGTLEVCCGCISRSEERNHNKLRRSAVRVRAPNPGGRPPLPSTKNDTPDRDRTCHWSLHIR